MKVGVLGAGVMGQGIAQAFAQTEGYTVVLADINQELADKGKAKIVGGLDKRVEKGKLDATLAKSIADAITTGTKESFTDVDLVVEAAIENLEIKKETFKALQAIVKPETLFATNTSSLSITEIGKGLDRPMIGMHFFNPAPVMKLVEVIPGLNTPTEMVDTIVKVANDLGKVPVTVQEGPGFVVNRILIPYVNEGISIYADGLASAEGIDTAMKLGANHPMGPLELGDLIGLDVCLAIMEVLHKEFGEDKYRPHPLLRKMVRGNKLGRKTKVGFYQY